MNRIICDICGSEYPETAERCPICSYPRQGTETVAASAAETARTKVKGGRYSVKNVKKRKKSRQKAVSRSKERSDKPLVIVIVLLLAAIALVSLYIGLRFFRGMGAYRAEPVVTTLPAATTRPQPTEAPTVPCAGIQVDDAVIALDEAGQEYRLFVRLLPENTTDAVAYSTSDPAVVTVSAEGILTAVGTGQAVVTVSCGAEQVSCSVVCWIREETTAPAETAAPTETTAPTVPPETTQATQPQETEPAVLALDPNDMSFFRLGETYTLSVKLGGSSVSRSKVVWSSSDPAVVAVENGTVTAVAPGTATITAEYAGQKATCIVRCRFADTSWRATSTDVTITVGEVFRLSVVNNSGETADAAWAMSTEGIVAIKGTSVTGLAPGTVTLTTEVDGVVMTCVVRVK